MNFRNIIKSKEFRIVVLIIAIIAIGTVALASAGFASDPTYSMIKKQGVAIVLGIIGMIIAASIDYEAYTRYWVLMYVPCLILLVLVLFTDPINNARSWFQFFDGKIAFQPSEIAKIVLIITTAHFLVKLKKTSMSSKNKATQILMMCLLIGIPVLLILLQPDFGTGMVFVAAVLAMIFVWGIDYKVIRLGFLGTLILAPITYFFFLKPGQKQRIQVFLNPDLDPTGAGYHVLQSKLAVGAGQFSGMGLFNGTQTQMGYLFANTTDFIFASIAEEMGFIVAVLLITLLLALVMQFYGVAKDARDEEGRLIAIGIGTMFAFHIFINIGMTMGLVPITGIPLPFVSYGGSAMLTNMIATGIVLGISLRKTGLRF